MSSPSSRGAGPHRAIVLLAPDMSPERLARAEATREQARRELVVHGHASALVDLGQAPARRLGEVAEQCAGPTVLHLGGGLALRDEAALTVLLGRFDAMRCLILDGEFDPSQATRLGRAVEWIVRIPVELELRSALAFVGELHVGLASARPVSLAVHAALDRARLGPGTDNLAAPELLHHGQAQVTLGPGPGPGPGPDLATGADADEPEDEDPDEPGVEMSEAERVRLLAVIERSSGIATSVAADLMLERRLGPRLEATDSPSFTEYLNHIEFEDEGEAELQRAIASITTHETYLFREQYQLDAMAEAILPELARQRASERTLRLWSAGCSTGEEAYTLAILLLESGLFEGWDLQVVGSDISERVLETARAGVYGPNSFRTTDEAVRDRYFSAQGRRWAVRDEVRALCSFEQHNLLDTIDHAPGQGPPDLVSCRNVLIYLSARARAQIIAGFHAQLRAQGYLLLGHSETRVDMGGRFELSSRKRELIYQRQS